MQNLPPKDKAILGAICVLGLFAITYMGASWTKPAPEIKLETKSPSGAATKSNSEQAAPDTLVVHVAGAVKQPGVFRLGKDARVHDAIRSAGGAKPNADLDSWNLAAKLQDGSQIYIMSKEAKKVASSSPTHRRTSARSSSSRSQPAPLSGNLPVRVEIPPEYRGGPGLVASLDSPKSDPEPKPRSSSGKKVAPAEGAISLNTATSDQLQALPGVGPATAEKILEYRREHGGFSSVDELLAVKGIGPKKLEAMRRYVRL